MSCRLCYVELQGRAPTTYPCFCFFGSANDTAYHVFFKYYEFTKFKFKFVSDKLVLPVSSITLDGSESSDDLAIESWEWSREPGTEFINIHYSFIQPFTYPRSIYTFIHSFIKNQTFWTEMNFY